MLFIESETSVIQAAVRWCLGLLTGQAATLIAIIAGATVGFALLQGRIDTKHAARVVLGCFILFGAPAIAAALMSVPQIAVTERQETPTSAAAPASPPPPPPAPYDPYAGASVPVR